MFGNTVPLHLHEEIDNEIFSPLLIPVLIGRGDPPNHTKSELSGFSCGFVDQLAFCFFSSAGGGLSESKFIRADSAKMRLNPAKKQNLVDKGLLPALVCFSTLGQARMA